MNFGTRTFVETSMAYIANRHYYLLTSLVTRWRLYRRSCIMLFPWALEDEYKSLCTVILFFSSSDNVFFFGLFRSVTTNMLTMLS